MKKPIFFSIVLMAIMAQAIQAQSLKLKWSTDSVFRVPESVLFDSKANLLYVSNIDGKSNEKDGKGFISKLSPDGKIIAMEWATGLNAPKGMGRFR
ncbi:MAG: ATP-binding protein, partial [Bacteroidota bacterium]